MFHQHFLYKSIKYLHVTTVYAGYIDVNWGLEIDT